jgi:hypothetical protein
MGGFDLGGMMESGEQQQLPQELQQMSADFQNSANEAEIKQLEDLAKKGVLIHVIAEGAKPIPGEARTRFYVKKTTEGGPMSLVDAAEKERGQYAFKPKYDTIQLPIGEAIRCKQSNGLRDGGTLHQISYVVVDGNDMYSLRFVTQEAAQTIESIAEQVAQSWRIKPSG